MKKILSFLLALLCVGTVRAAELPTVSTAGNEVWYLIQFLNGENVLTARGEGEKVIAGAPMAKDSQLWKLEGSASGGYTFTSKNGLKLYTSTTALNGMFHASSAPANNTLFVIQNTTNSTYADGFVISPKANTNLYMNQWEGASTGALLGLWNERSDANQPLKFVKVEDFLAKDQPLPLIPYPASLTRGDGNYATSALTTVTYANEASKPLADVFAAQFSTVTGQVLGVELAGASAKTNAINMVLDTSKAAEGYSLTIDANGVVIAASQYAGFFYALQTLKQLLPAAIYADAKVDNAASWTLPYVEIEDEPLLAYRGFLLDVSRHFFTVDEVKKLLDMAAIYKLNRFHWHLTDDHGWRIEIPEYPRLTTVGAVRKSSLTLNFDSQFYDDTEYGVGCYYTLDELREVVAYAKERNIEIMPEVDLPGHMLGAITAYPELSCDPSKKYEVRVAAGISSDVLNIGDDKVIDFLKCVLGHVAEVFPYEYLHIGGDECPTTAWVGHPDCARRIAEEGLSGVEELQPWLVEELGSWLKREYKKDIVVWDELLSHWSSKFTVTPAVMVWNNASYAVQAAGHGLKSIQVPTNPLYFDYMQIPINAENIDEPYVGGWGVKCPLPNVYGFNPLAGLEGNESFLLGTQANLWTESLTTIKEAEYQLYPRLLAVSEIAWLPAAKKNWMNFYLRLQQGVKVLDANNIFYAKHYIEEPELTEAEAAVKEATELLDASKPGNVGYPAVADFENLRTAKENAAADLNDAEAVANLKTAIAAYKQAPLVNFENGKFYQIISAATATRARYDGSTVYVKDGQLRIHYTPQLEPEELWEAVAQGDGSFVLKQATTGKNIEMSAYGSVVTVSADNATPIVIGKPTANAVYSYFPGVVTLSAAADKTGNVRRFFGNTSGLITADKNAEICYGGTWRVVEVTDYKAFLEALCKKCERIIETARPGELEQPTVEAIAFLSNSVIVPARATLETGKVTKDMYMVYADLYQQYVNMPRTSALSLISEGVYYHIQNAYFTDYYAQAAASTGVLQPKRLNASNDYQLWRFVKNDNGTVQIINKGTGKAAYITSSTEEVSVSARYADTGLAEWSVMYIETDLGIAGLAFVDPSGTYSWYTNPDVFANIITKPKNWGGSIWNLVATDIETGIGNVGILRPSNGEVSLYYDLHGRRVSPDSNGIYVSSNGEKVIK